MKRTLFSIALFLMIASPCLAASGKAIIPRYVYFSGQNSCLSLSNITGSQVDVSLTLLKQNNSSGQYNILTDCNASSTAGAFLIGHGSHVTNYSETTPGVSAKFTIAAYETVEFYITNSCNASGEAGYGFIEWYQSSSMNTVALVAHLFGQSSVQINGGLPF